MTLLNGSSDASILFDVLLMYIPNARRRWIQADLSDDNHYVDPVVVGEVMRSAGIGKVIKTSGDSKVQEGDYVSCVPGWREYAVLPSRSLRLLKYVALSWLLRDTVNNTSGKTKKGT